uniref:Uncharacterized protein n=1 Tax=Schizaphis graminum TaxID=13262 RepID=A0A2S2PHH8_SCHGA
MCVLQVEYCSYDWRLIILTGCKRSNTDRRLSYGWPPNSGICSLGSTHRVGWLGRILLPRIPLLETHTTKKIKSKVLPKFAMDNLYCTHRLYGKQCCWRCASGRRCHPANTNGKRNLRLW